ncbi:MAG: alpha/beta fold hydrolase [Bacteriovoracaceae bacterium]|nr:alpha/beta fold hydrolase [Bacteriovoracaceae bacterium]
MTSAHKALWDKPIVQELWKFPLRLRNLGLLKSPSMKEGIAGTPFEVLGRRGRCRLLKYLPSPGIKASGEAIFITPSLINRYYILDLYKGCSFIENLVDHGHTVYLLDWGAPREHDRFATLEDHILNWHNWAFDLSLEDFEVSEIHLLGQCIGGTFAALYAAINPQKIKSLVLLTSPIDFHVEGTFYQWANDSNVNLEQMAEVWGNIRHDFLNKTFKMLTPLGDLKQWQSLLKLSWDKDFVRKYAAINSWVADNINFPGLTYKKFIEELYQDNKLINDQFFLGEHLIDLKKITAPILCFYASGDIIVPAQSSLAIEEYATKFKKVALGGGHIGCVISGKYQKVFWNEVENWLQGVE